MNSEYRDFAIDLTKKVATFALSRFQTLTEDQIDEKNYGEIVTVVDAEVEKMVRAEVALTFTGHSVFGEEDGGLREKFTWVVDPIDGTTNFTQGLPIWCISLALYRDNKPVLGVVYAPILNELFYAELGVGAYLNDEKLTPGTRRLSSKSLVCVGIRAKESISNSLYPIEYLLRHKIGVRAYGSGALSLCYIAAGRFDGFVETTINWWDIAAAKIILEEAGCWCLPDSVPADWSDDFPIAAGAPGTQSLLTDLYSYFERGI